MWKDIVTLRTATMIADSFGDEVKSYTDVDVFVNKKSVARTEFYSSSMAGLKVDTVFQVRSEDFAGQTEAIHETVNYEIIRAYQKGEGHVELMCARREVV